MRTVSIWMPLRNLWNILPGRQHWEICGSAVLLQPVKGWQSLDGAGSPAFDSRLSRGADGYRYRCLLNLPIWDLTAEASRKLLAGEPLETVMDELDQQAEEDGPQ